MNFQTLTGFFLVASVYNEKGFIGRQKFPIFC